MQRPKMTVLPDSALVDRAPARSRRSTHEVVAPQPFFAAGSELPIGHFAAGARVRLLSTGDGPRCTVRAPRGTAVETELAGLRPLR